MALQINPHAYTGGAERFNPLPHTQLYIQLKQREQAKNEAFDEYLRNLNKNINSAGLRNQERPVFEQKLAEWQKFGMENRDKLRNPRQDKGGASLEFQNKYQDILNLVAESKMEEEKKKPLIEIATDPNKRDRLSADIIPDIASHDEPIYITDKNGQIIRNPDRRSFDVSKIMFDPKPFEQDKYFKSFDDVKRSDLSPTVVKNPKDMTQTITTTSVFDQGAKDLIATRAVGEYMNNKSFKATIDKLNPDEYNDVYKKNYGHDIQTPADLAAAYTLAGLQQKTVTSKLENDTFERQKQMAAINHGYRLGEKQFEHALKGADEQTQDLWLDDHIDKLTEDAKKQPSRLYVGGGLGYEIPLNATLAKSLAKDGNSPDKLIVTMDGKYVPIFYQRNKDGIIMNGRGKDQFPVVDEIATVPIDRNQLKLDLGGQVGVKQKNKEMSAGQKSINSSPTPAALVKQSKGNPPPNGKEYVEDEGFKFKWNPDKSRYDPDQTQFKNITSGTHNGKRVQIGYKDGKWYNIQTTEEIK